MLLKSNLREIQASSFETTRRFELQPIDVIYSQSKPKTITMKCVILSTLLVGAAAFAPAQTGKASTALAADLTAEVGAQAPLGCFDPLGVLGDPKDGDQEQFDNLRYIELKHGRVAMLAFVGYIVTYVSLMLRAGIFAYPFVNCRYFHERTISLTSELSSLLPHSSFSRPAFDSLEPRTFPLDLPPSPPFLAWCGLR